MSQPEPVLKQYDYRPRQWQTVALFLLALGGSVVLTYLAISLEGPLDVKGFQLTQMQGRILFGVFAVLSPIGLFCLGAMVYAAFAYDRRVALTESHLIVPKPTRMGLSCHEIEIPLDAISLITIHDFIGATKLLRLDHSEGVLNIPSNMFRSRDEFYEMCHAVQDGVRNARNSREKTALVE